MNLFQKFHSKWPIKNRLTYWEIRLFQSIMNPQLCKTKGQTVHFIIKPEGIGLHRPQSQGRASIAPLVKQAHKEHPLLRNIYTHTHTDTSFILIKKKWRKKRDSTELRTARWTHFPYRKHHGQIQYTCSHHRKTNWPGWKCCRAGAEANYIKVEIFSTCEQLGNTTLYFVTLYLEKLRVIPATLDCPFGCVPLSDLTLLSGRVLGSH